MEDDDVHHYTSNTSRGLFVRRADRFADRSTSPVDRNQSSTPDADQSNYVPVLRGSGASSPRPGSMSLVDVLQREREQHAAVNSRLRGLTLSTRELLPSNPARAGPGVPSTAPVTGPEMSSIAPGNTKLLPKALQPKAAQPKDHRLTQPGWIPSVSVTMTGSAPPGAARGGGFHPPPPPLSRGVTLSDSIERQRRSSFSDFQRNPATRQGADGAAAGQSEQTTESLADAARVARLRKLSQSSAAISASLEQRNILNEIRRGGRCVVEEPNPGLLMLRHKDDSGGTEVTRKTEPKIGSGTAATNRLSFADSKSFFSAMGTTDSEPQTSTAAGCRSAGVLTTPSKISKFKMFSFADDDDEGRQPREEPWRSGRGKETTTAKSATSGKPPAAWSSSTLPSWSRADTQRTNPSDQSSTSCRSAGFSSTPSKQSKFHMFSFDDEHPPRKHDEDDRPAATSSSSSSPSLSVLGGDGRSRSRSPLAGNRTTSPLAERHVAAAADDERRRSPLATTSGRPAAAGRQLSGSGLQDGGRLASTKSIDDDGYYTPIPTTPRVVIHAPKSTTSTSSSPLVDLPPSGPPSASRSPRSFNYPEVTARSASPVVPVVEFKVVDGFGSDLERLGRWSPPPDEVEQNDSTPACGSAAPAADPTEELLDSPPPGLPDGPPPPVPASPPPELEDDEPVPQGGDRPSPSFGGWSHEGRVKPPASTLCFHRATDSNITTDSGFGRSEMDCFSGHNSSADELDDTRSTSIELRRSKDEPVSGTSSPSSGGPVAHRDGAIVGRSYVNDEALLSPASSDVVTTDSEFDDPRTDDVTHIDSDHPQTMTSSAGGKSGLLHQLLAENGTTIDCLVAQSSADPASTVVPSRDDTKTTVPRINSDVPPSTASPTGLMDIQIVKGSLGLGFCLEGGVGSTTGDRPITVKRIFRGDDLRPGDEIVSVNGDDYARLSHYDAWNRLKALPDGMITITIRRQ